ncbi:MAG: HAMP domain-containing histidine kinase [Lysobacter sp.]|nr:HAMP domain-containing histidine kinase [Lysobacter sp.]
MRGRRAAPAKVRGPRRRIVPASCGQDAIVADARSRSQPGDRRRRCGRAKPSGPPILAASSARNHGLSLSTASAQPSQDYQRRELYLFALYRVLEAGLLALLVFGPVAKLQPQVGHEALVAGVSIVYFAVSLLLLMQARKAKSLTGPTLIGVGIDIVVATLVAHAVPSAGSGVALMLLFNVGSASLLLSLRTGLIVASLASAGLAIAYLWTLLVEQQQPRPLAELMMFTVSFLAIATLTHQLRVQMRATEALAERRGAEAIRLAEINELIIRRMRTGVLLVDREAQIRLANEAAMLLLGEGAAGTRHLAEAAPELALRLSEWLRSGLGNDTPLRLGGDQFEVVPRFARLLANSDNTLIFLDDTSLVSRRAESLTLAAMGRFSASLAHEIRNPLAAISYAAQLLEESRELPDGDRRMVQIIHQQCMRTNSIVESVLGLARRERATAEHIELVSFLRNFIEEFRQSVPDETDNITLAAPQPLVPALVDPKHLHQIVTAMVQNARRHGHLPGEPARITLHAYRLDDAPVIDIIDRGPGIPEAVVPQLFRPFFTTSEHGTGLGLYIARELCRANGASLDYVPVPGGGCCFRIGMPGQHTLLPA